MTSRTRRALTGALCLIAATAPLSAQIEAPADEEATAGAARGAALVRIGEAELLLDVLPADTAHGRDGDGHALTVWAAEGARDFVGDMVAALRLVPGEGGWTAEGQITLIEETSFHGAILDTEFGALFEVVSLSEDGGILRLALRAEGPSGRAQGDVGSNDFSQTVPGAATILLEVPLGAPPPPPPD